MPFILRTPILIALAVAVAGPDRAPVASVTAAPAREDLAPYAPEDLECLALNIYHEARSEPEEGRLAVAAVTLNRVESKRFPDSVCDVVKQGGQRLNRCQFSWWCDGKRDTPTETTAWEDALRVSRMSLLGFAEDPTDGALYYHADYVRPRWSKSFQRTAEIGNHLFYRPRPRPAPALQVASAD